MSLLKNRRGVVGLDTGSAFIIGILILSVFAFATIIVISSLNGSEAVKDTRTVSNETGGGIVAAGYQLVKTAQPGVDSVIITTATNGTAGGSAITSGNFTVTAQGFVENATAVVWADVDFKYTYRAPLTTNVGQNVSSGLVTLFTNAGTWFSLIAVVIIILIIAVVVVAVNQFGGTARKPGL